MVSDDRLGFIERQARRNNISERQYCINQIEHWRECLEAVSKDFRELNEVEYQKRLDEEILERESE